MTARNPASPEIAPPVVQLVRLAVERVASAPEDEQRYLELNFALDRAVEKNIRYRELLSLLEEGATQADPGTGWAWRLAVGLAANLMGDSPAAVGWLEAARAALDGIGRSQTAADAFIHGELARAYYHLPDNAAGIDAAGRALQLARSARSLLAEAFSHHYLGLIATSQRDYAYARRHIDSARRLFERMQQRHGRARVMDSQAVLEMEQGRYDVALPLLQESLRIKERLRDLRGQALSWGNLARLHTGLGDYDEALSALQRQQDFAARIGDERSATRVRVHRGVLHLRHSQVVSAREELLEACALAGQRRDLRLEAYADFSLAEAEWRLGQPGPAREAARRAAAYFTSSDDKVMCERAALRVALLEGHSLEASEIQGPLDRLRSAGNPQPLAEALFEVANVLRERGDPYPITTLYAEAMDVAEPHHADQLADIIRSRADSEEARAWVDTMLVIKRQKDRLESAYAELSRVERLRDSLMQMIVHDLKNPITAITPWLYTLQSGVLEPEEAEECLQQAIDECDTLLRMIDDLNDVGKMQLGGEPELSLEPVCLNELLSAVARRLQARAHEAGLGLIVDELPEVPVVQADKPKLRRVLENLIANGIKYGRPPDGSGRPAEVRLALCVEPPMVEGELPALRIEIRDFGVGIPPAESDRVFEPYYQAEAGRTRKAGVGLGLAFSRMVVEAHGGTIWTQPNPDGGTIFAFRLPLPEQGTGVG